MSQLGTFHRIRNIRGQWPNEAQDFTPWLANHLELLAEALGLGADGLTLQDTEVPVGAFSADIVATDTTRQIDETVLIENQYGRSDHDHFGKLLTYASGLKAATVVLICEKLREEHRTALTWLNSITADDHRFFAIELELWCIDDSAPAPRFNVVVQPDDWARMAETTKRIEKQGEFSELQKTYLSYWGALRDYVTEMNESEGRTSLRPRSPQAQYWTGFSIGRASMELNAFANAKDCWLRAELTLYGPHARGWHAELKDQRQDIERDLGFELDWSELDGTQQRISIAIGNQDPTDKSRWREQHAWLYKHLNDLHTAFQSRVRTLK